MQVLAFSISVIAVVQFGAIVFADGDPGNGLEMDGVLTREQVNDDLNDLQRFIDKKWLLSNLSDTDFPAAIDDARNRIGETISLGAFVIVLQRILARGADGHAQVDHLLPALMNVSKYYFPFSIEPLGDRYVAVDVSNDRRNQLWDDKHPFIVKIQGVDIGSWVKMAMPLVSQSNELAMRTKAAALLRYPGYFRQQLQLKEAPRIRITLESNDGRRHERAIELADMPPSLRKYNDFLESMDREWAVLEPAVGYIWLEKSSAGIVRRIVEAMPHFRDTRGLILDLRENDGGSPEFSQILGMWLANSDEPRIVGGIDRRRAGNHGASTFRSYRVDDKSVTEIGREVIRNGLDNLSCEWQAQKQIPTHDRCCLLSSPRYEPRINDFDHPRFSSLISADAIYEYRKPVVVIVDRHCFSAAEVAASQLGQFANVTIMGEQTIGGGGAQDFHTLPATGLKISAAIEAVYLTSRGHPIDGVGIQPDIVVPLDLRTLIGPNDTILERAIDHVSCITGDLGISKPEPSK